MAFNYRVTLQVRHPDADPQRIVAAIGLLPGRYWAMGEERSTPKGQSLPGTYQESYCYFDLGEGNDGQLADFLHQAIGRLEHAAEFIAELRQTGGSFNFGVSWSPGPHGEVFNIELLADMARLGIDLGIDPVC